MANLTAEVLTADSPAVDILFRTNRHHGEYTRTSHPWRGIRIVGDLAMNEITIIDLSGRAHELPAIPAGIEDDADYDVITHSVLEKPSEVVLNRVRTPKLQFTTEHDTRHMSIHVKTVLGAKGIELSFDSPGNDHGITLQRPQETESAA